MKIVRKFLARFKRPKSQPVDWSQEKKNIYIFKRGTRAPMVQGSILDMACSLLAIDGVNDPLIIVEYPDLLTIEIMISGGDPGEVAKAILNTRPMGVRTIGNIHREIEFYHVPHNIKFTNLNWLGVYDSRGINTP